MWIVKRQLLQPTITNLKIRHALITWFIFGTVYFRTRIYTPTVDLRTDAVYVPNLLNVNNYVVINVQQCSLLHVCATTA